MKKTLLLAALLSGCVQTARIPPADLAYTSVTHEQNNLLYLRFSSNIELTRALRIYENTNQLPPRIVCALGTDANFSVDHINEHSAEGTVELDDAAAPKGGFAFRASMHPLKNGEFSSRQIDTDDHGTASRVASPDPIQCKVIIYTYGFHPYYSKSLYVPIGDWAPKQ